jgi:hypothetical protein
MFAHRNACLSEHGTNMQRKRLTVPFLIDLRYTATIHYPPVGIAKETENVCQEKSRSQLPPVI